MIARGRVLVPLLATAALLGGCGDSEDEPAEPRTDAVAETPERPSCGEFCAQLGGFGAGPEPELEAVEFSEEPLVVGDDGIVEIKGACTLDEDCVGAVVLTGDDGIEYGRADLEIPAESDGTVPVEISPEGLESLGAGNARIVVTAGFVDESLPVVFTPLVPISGPE